MNYRHAFHAGNFADVMKHAALARLLALMAAKAKPFAVIDTHAGLGRYDLASPEAFRGGEARDGIGRLWAARQDPGRPGGLDPYLDAVAALNAGRDAPLIYPGSPMIARAALRPGDRLRLIEKHPDDARVLAALFSGDKAVQVQAGDGWDALRALLPPPERRGLVLIDPPFEEAGEFDRLAQALAEGWRRFATGVFVLWYPIKDEAQVARFRDAVARTGARRVLVAELRVSRPRPRGGLHGAGLILVNPTWPFAEECPALLAWLARLLAQGPEAYAQVDWLVGE